MSKSNQIGAVSLGVNLDTAKLGTQANAIPNKFNGVFSGIGKKLGLAFSAAFSVAGISKIISKTADLGDTIDKMSQKLGMSAKAYQEWDFIMEHSGASIDSMTTAMKTLASSAVTGKDALAELGITQADVAHMSQEELFSRTIAGLQGVTDTTRRTYLAGQLLGRGATELGALLNRSAEDTDNMRRRLEELGGVMSDRGVKNAAAYKDAITDIKAAFKGIYNTLAENVLPVLTKLINNYIIPAIRAFNSFIGAIVKAANTFKAFVFSLFGKASQDMTTGSAAVVDAAAGIADSTAGAASGLDDVGSAAGGAADDTAAAAKKIKRALMGFDQIQKLSDMSDTSSGGGSGGGSGISGGGGGLGDTSSALKDTAYEVSSENGPLARILASLTAIKDLFVGGFWEGFGDITVFESIKENIAGIGTSLKNIFTDANVMAAAENFSTAFITSMGKVVGSFASIGATIMDNITGGINKWLQNDSNRISNWLSGMLNIGAEVSELIGDFSAAAAEIFSVFRSEDAKTITADIISLFSTAFGGVTTLAAKLGSDILGVIVTPITENAGSIKQALQDTLAPLATAFDTIVQGWQYAWDKVQTLYDEHIHPIFESIKTTISTVVGNLADGWSTYVAPVLDSLAQKFQPLFENHIKPMLDALADLFGTIFDILGKLWDKVLSPLFIWISENIMPVLATVIDVLGSGLLNAIEGISDIVTGIASALEYILSGKLWEDIKKKWDEFKDKHVNISVALEKAKQWAEDAWSAIKDGAQTIAHKVTTALSKASTWASEAWDAVKNGAQTVAHKVTTALSKASTWASEAWDAVKEGAKNITHTVFTKLEKAGEWSNNAWSVLSGNVTEAVSVGVSLVKNGWNKVKEWVSGFLGSGDVDQPIGLKKSLTNAWDTVTTWVKNYLKGDVNQPVGLIKSITNAWKTVTSWVAGFKNGDVSQSIGLTKTTVAGKIWNTVTSWVSGFKKGDVSQTVALTRVSSWLGKTVTSWVAGFKKGDVSQPVALTRAASWVGKTVAGWVNGLKNAIGTVMAPVGLKKDKDWSGHSVVWWITYVANAMKGTLLAPVGLKKGEKWTGHTVAWWIENVANALGKLTLAVGLKKKDGNDPDSWAKFGTVAKWVMFNPVDAIQVISLAKKKAKPEDGGWSGQGADWWVMQNSGGAATQSIALTKYGGPVGEGGWAGQGPDWWVIQQMGSSAISVAIKLVKFGDAITARFASMLGFANGGIIRAFGSMTDSIPQYAGGTTRAHGSLFVAGEAGPEIVGHIGGRTEILNKSQLASTMYSSVRAAMTPLVSVVRRLAADSGSFSRERFTPYVAQAGVSGAEDTAQLVQMAREAARASQEGSVAEVVQNLKEILYLLKHLNLDIQMDGQSVTNRVVKLINANTRATGVCEIVMG